jgi:AcrR family transcriptional regulator
MADQQPGSSPSAVAEEGSEELPGADRVTRMLAAELGPQMAGAFARSREVQERIARERHPSEGLRERKKRLTRQQISDAATTLFIVRGFEHVTVAQIAEVVGVSEKTVYNYFPTKESLVFDRAEEGTERLASMMREREPGESPTRVMLTAIEHELSELEELPDETHMLLPLFAEMVSCTPALRAAWLELQDRLTDLVTNELARHADIDPREPEPRIAASALLGLQAVAFSSRIRHVEDGLRGRALSEAIANDLRRAARLLDTGLWSFSLLTYGMRTLSQWREASLATEESREQVIAALKRARSSWQELRGQAREQTRTQRNEIKREAKAKQAAARKQARQAVRASEAAARERTKRKVAEVRGRPGAGQSSRDGAERARAAYGAFRAAMAERHEAIRGRSPSPSLTGDDAGAPDD